MLNDHDEKEDLARRLSLKAGVKLSTPEEIEGLLSKLEVIPGFPLNSGSLLAGRLDQLAGVAQSHLASIPDRAKRSPIDP